jgi:4-amino-4-deoxy-L-arabinose transferase-like glycosyltransferase
MPYLGSFPAPTDWGEMEIAATAHKLATRGIHGNDLFTGFYGSEDHYFVFMPLHPVLMAASFKLFGLGIVQARLVSVACGGLILWLTYCLGRRLEGPGTGLVAAAALCVARLAVEPVGSGIPVVDLARSMRFDILVPVWVLASCLAFVRAERMGSAWGFFVTGALVGLATLSHVWGAFILPLFVALLVWREGWAGVRKHAALVIVGFALAVFPWIAFALRHADDFLGQMCRHDGRFDVLDPQWYLLNLRREHWRYARWVGGAFSQPLLWPRLGVWVVAAAALWGNVTLVSRLRRDRRMGDVLLFAALPVLGLAMGLLVSQKRYPYTLLVLPFLALQVGIGVVSAWSRAEGSKALRALMAAVLLAVVGEGGIGIGHALARAGATTSYATAVAAAASSVPAGARVLISQPYWMGLQGYTARSAMLPVFLADPRCHPHDETPSIDEALRHAQVEYAMLEDRFVDYRNRENTRVEDLMRRLERAVRLRCPAAIGRIAVPDYDAATVYRCNPG